MANTLELYANNARTTLAGSLSNVATSVVLQSGAGALFPSPNNGLGQFAKATIQDAATGLRNEIVYITARTGDVLTVLRGQDGTTAQTWSAGDTVFEGVTAATLASFVQPVTVQDSTLVHTTAGGTADAITATYTPAYTAWVDGMTFFAKITAANTTTTPTISPNGLAAKTIVIGNGIPGKANMLTVGMIAEFKYSSTLDKVLLQNQNITGGLLNVQTFATAGTFTYTPTPGTRFYRVKALGGGGGGGSTSACTASQISLGSGGESGAYGEGIYFPANPSATVSVTVGAAGVGGVAGGAAATAGGTSSFGALLSVSGGQGASTGTASSTVPEFSNSFPTSANTISGANIVSRNSKLPMLGMFLSINRGSNNGGADSEYGVGGKMTFSGVGTSSNGNNATGNGAGGGGAVTVASGVAKSGGNGSPGLIIVEEYM